MKTHIGDVLVHRGEPHAGNPYHGESLTGKDRVRALRDFKIGADVSAYTFWHAPSCGGARRITRDEVDWESSGIDETIGCARSHCRFASYEWHDTVCAETLK